MSELVFQGKLKEVVLPSGRIVEIRQHNGDDEAILSTNNDDNLILYLVSIITKGGKGKDGKCTVEEVKTWGVKDKYYLVFAARVHSIGGVMKFKHNEKVEKANGTSYINETAYEEDLTRFMFDFRNIDHYEKTHEYQVTPYPQGTTPIIELTLSSGKELRYRIMDSELETDATRIPPDKVNKLTPFTSRKLEMRMNGDWKYVTFFSNFSPQDLIELRASIKQNDTLFEPISEFESPVTGRKFSMSLMTSPAFFYPEEI